MTQPNSSSQIQACATSRKSKNSIQALSKGLFKLNRTYRLQYESARGCHVLLFPEGMVELNETASLILGLCLNDISLMELLELLENKFPDVDLKNDVEDFLLSAFEEKWLEYTNPV